jgi:ubiquinone/menaquinone biosynthesis C-methylase UbiE
VLHHAPNIEKAIDEIYRVMKPEGEVIVMLYNKNSVFFWWDIVFIEGVILMNFLRESIRDRLSRIEYTTLGAKPLVRVYTKKQVRRLFNKFRKINIQVFQLKKDDIWLPFIGNYTKRFIPGKLIYLVSRLWGWNLFIRAIK